MVELRMTLDRPSSSATQVILEHAGRAHSAGPDLARALRLCERINTLRHNFTIEHLHERSVDPRLAREGHILAVRSIAAQFDHGQVAVRPDSYGHDLQASERLITIARALHVPLFFDALSEFDVEHVVRMIRTFARAEDIIGFTLSSRYRRSMSDVDVALHYALPMRIIDREEDSDAEQMRGDLGLLQLVQRLAPHVPSLTIASEDTAVVQRAIELGIDRQAKIFVEVRHGRFHQPLVDVAERAGVPLTWHLPFGRMDVPYDLSVRTLVTEPQRLTWLVKDFLSFSPRQPVATRRPPERASDVNARSGQTRERNTNVPALFPEKRRSGRTSAGSFRTINVWQVLPTLAVGGIQRRMARVSEALEPEGFRSTFVGFSERDDALWSNWGTNNFRFIGFHKNPGLDYRLVLSMAEAMRRAQPDIVHVHNFATSVYGIIAARIAGIPRVIYGVGGRDNVSPSTKQAMLLHALVPYIDRFTVVCQFLADELATASGVDPARVRVIPTSIDPARFDGLIDKKTARDQLGLPHDRVLVGTLCAVRPVKRIEDLVLALAHPALRDSNVDIVVAGPCTPTSREALDDMCRAADVSGRLHLVGQVEDRTALAALDIFVNSSDFEGVSNAILEAMAASIPIVATRVGGTPEVIEEEISGLLVPARDPAAIATAIARVVRDESLRIRFVANARRTLLHQRSIDMMIDGYRDLYVEILAEEGATLARRSSKSMVRAMRAATLLRRHHHAGG